MGSEPAFIRDGWYPSYSGSRLHYLRGRYSMPIHIDDRIRGWEWFYLSLCGIPSPGPEVKDYSSKASNCKTCTKLLADFQSEPPILCEAYGSDILENQLGWGWCGNEPTTLYNFTVLKRESMFLCRKHFKSMLEWESSRNEEVSSS